MFLLRKYSDLLTKYPLSTKSVTGGFMFSLADIMVQTQEKYYFTKPEKRHEHKYNFRRTGLAWIMGNVFMMPLFHYWFTNVLPWMVKRVPIDTSRPFVYGLVSMSIDQTIWASYILCHYFIFINLLEHGSVRKGIDTIKQNFFAAMITNWTIWPAAQILNFWLIPMQYRVLWVNFIGLFWNIYLCYIQHN